MHTRFFRIKPFLTTAFFLIAGISFLAVDGAAQIELNKKASAEDYAVLVALAKEQLKQRKKSASYSTKVKHTALQSITRIAESRTSNLRLNAHLEARRATLYASYPILFEKLWLNARATLNESDHISDTSIYIGKIKLPKFISKAIANAIIEKYTKQTLSDVDDIVSFKKIEPDKLDIHLSKLPENSRIFKKIFDSYATIERKHLDLSIDIIEHYRARFLQLSKTAQATKEQHSISLYLHYLISTQPDHKKRTDLKHALLALNSLTGISYFNQALSIQHASTQNIPFTLAKRQDLAKHFLLSAALKLISDDSTSGILGEAKEILDSRGGSGFSFIDLAAGRAGILFAEHYSRARIDLDGSQALKEHDFFPSTIELKEGITEAQFLIDYASTESPKYKELIRLIDKRILSSKLYTGMNTDQRQLK